MKKRFIFTKKNRGKTENVGYLDFEVKDEEQTSCSLYFYGDIVSEQWISDWDEESKCPADIADFLNQLEGYEDIDIYFNSGGGDVFAGLAIYNQLKRYSGHKAMIHNPLCRAFGNADDLQEAIKQLDLCEDSIVDVYMQHTLEGVTRDEIKDLMRQETWFNAEMMQQYFDVQIEEKAAVAACASDYFDKYNNLPESLAKKEKTKDIVNAVIEELENRNGESEKQRIEAEKAEILEDLYQYGT